MHDAAKRAPEYELQISHRGGQQFCSREKQVEGGSDVPPSCGKARAHPLHQHREQHKDAVNTDAQRLTRAHATHAAERRPALLQNDNRSECKTAANAASPLPTCFT